MQTESSDIGKAEKAAQKDYRDYLRVRFSQARSRSPRFSQGAFARTLGLSPSRLSDVLRGRQGLSASVAFRVAEKLELDPTETSKFCDLVAERHGRSRLEREAARRRLEARELALKRKPLEPVEFAEISDWYHFAILELLHAGPRSARVLSERLSLPEPLVVEALRRLQRLGFAAKREKSWRPTGQPLEVRGGIPSSHVRKFHRQILERAIGSLESVPVPEREVVTSLVRIRPEQMPRLREALAELRRAFDVELEQENGRERLYALALQFFPLGR